MRKHTEEELQSNTILRGEKSYPSDFPYGMVVGSRKAGLNICLSGIFPHIFGV